MKSMFIVYKSKVFKTHFGLAFVLALKILDISRYITNKVNICINIYKTYYPIEFSNILL